MLKKSKKYEKNSRNYLSNKSLCGTVPFLKFWLPVYLYAGLIFFHSAQTYPPLMPKILYADKLFHFIEYAIFGFLLARAARCSSSVNLRTQFRIFAVGVAFLYGVSDEFHQYFVPGREVEFLDLVADSLGAFFGQLLIR
jgi:VanZ family protein